MFPAKFHAGDTLTLTGDLGGYDYQADTFTLYLRRREQLEKIAGTPREDGVDYVLSSAQSGLLQNGGWEWSVVVDTSTTTSHTISSGTTTVLPDPRKVNITRAQRILSLIDDRLEGRYTDEMESVTYGGTSLTKMSTADLERFRDKYAAYVAREHKAARVRKGKKTGPMRRTFVNPY